MPSHDNIRTAEQLIAEGVHGALPWRDHLTPDERAVIEAAEVAKSEWLRLNGLRAGIVNRAIQRAKYAARRKPGEAA